MLNQPVTCPGKAISRCVLIISSGMIVALGSCSKRASSEPQTNAQELSGTTAAARAGTAKTDPCALLTSEEIESVQGEQVKEAHSSSQTGPAFVVAQCFFVLPTSEKSISLNVTRRSEGPSGRDPKELWQETFHGRDDSDKEGKDGGEEEERKSQPEQIAGVGDEAFWSASAVGGALHFLKGDVFVRISVGGPGDVASKLEKSKRLSQFILKRL